MPFINLLTRVSVGLTPRSVSSHSYLNFNTSSSLPKGIESQNEYSRAELCYGAALPYRPPLPASSWQRGSLWASCRSPAGCPTAEQGPDETLQKERVKSDLPHCWAPHQPQNYRIIWCWRSSQSFLLLGPKISPVALASPCTSCKTAPSHPGCPLLNSTKLTSSYLAPGAQKLMQHLSSAEERAIIASLDLLATPFCPNLKHHLQIVAYSHSEVC